MLALLVLWVVHEGIYFSVDGAGIATVLASYGNIFLTLNKLILKNHQHTAQKIQVEQGMGSIPEHRLTMHLDIALMKAII